MYNLSDINHVFDESSFKSFDNQAKQWITVQNNHKEYFKDVSNFFFRPALLVGLEVQMNQALRGEGYLNCIIKHSGR